MQERKFQTVVLTELKALRKDVNYLKTNLPTKEDPKGFLTKDDAKNFLTKDDAKNFATKDDLRNFATKDDLRNFATKDDLKNFATKEDLKNLATKDDLRKVAVEVIKNREEINVLKPIVYSTRNDVRLILNRIDHFAKRVDVVAKKDMVQDHRLLELEDSRVDHERRIATLEARK